MNDEWKQDFKKFGKPLSDGSLFLVAKDPKYIGFSYIFDPKNDDIAMANLYEAYEFFKKIVDD